MESEGSQIRKRKRKMAFEVDNPPQTSPEMPDPAFTSRNKAQEKDTSRWLIWAVSSGTFAAFNGVFAKLTTTAQTEGFALVVSRILGFSDGRKSIELIVRCIFFGLNLLSNATMWILFTRALTAASSTTRVSIINTSANFIVTALLGILVFGEKLPLGWWAGAVMLVAGSVIIGTRGDDEGVKRGSDEGRITLPESDKAGHGAELKQEVWEPYEDTPRGSSAREAI